MIHIKKKLINKISSLNGAIKESLDSYVQYTVFVVIVDTLSKHTKSLITVFVKKL